ncbi:F-box/kelch-repeat protein At3g06240-like [Lotus japonicus]|uniref:F-box/kelch-repeat protein At3g06240-like n=1 Tax=Lotus japonicus TaxID=34305 RepID=UPI00259005FB|nr:F-box/kelch-repeat protein At3g06240-like [Lotus japonicus]
MAFKLLSMSATNPGMEIPVPTFKRFRICDHSNGILCLSAWSTDDAQVLLYNPLTKEFRQLPPYTIEHSSRVAVGMGYDSFTDDFKDISIWKRQTATNYYATEQYTLMIVLQCALKELSTGGHGALKTISINVMVALNMDDRVFQIVPKPLGARIGQPHSRSLTVWNDSISLVCYDYYTSSDIDIWVMDGFGSWTLMRTIENLGEEKPKPLIFWKGNELLMRRLKE